MKQGLLITLASALATAALIKAVPALAEPAPQNVAIVHTADLDLRSEAGRAQLERRLVQAAHDVCDNASDVDVAGKNEVRRCRADVLARAHIETQQLASRDSFTVTVAASR